MICDNMHVNVLFSLKSFTNFQKKGKKIIRSHTCCHRSSPNDPLNRLRDFVVTTFTTGVPNSKHTTGLCRDNCRRLHSHSSVPTLIKTDTLYIIPTIANLVSVFGGGWGYSGKSCDAILFTAEKEILLNGLNLYGGRGNYAAKLKVQRRLRSLKRYLTFSRLL